MSENTTESTADNHEVEDVESPAQEIDWKAMARKHEDEKKALRKRLKELEPKAAQLDEITESQKSELQRLQERAEAAERQAQELALAKDRAEVAADKGVPANLLHGTTREELEAAADALLEFRGEQVKPAPRSSSFDKANAALPLNGDGIENALRNALGIH